MAQSDAIVVLEDDGLAVRPAVRESADEPFDRRPTDPSIVELDDSGDSTHLRRPIVRN